MDLLGAEPGGCIRGEREENGLMSAEDLEKYEAEMELQLYREYRDVVGLFTHVVETERRFYLTNDVELNVGQVTTVRSSSRLRCGMRGCGTCTAPPGS
jgi:ribosome biogenesis protein Nip4